MQCNIHTKYYNNNKRSHENEIVPRQGLICGQRAILLKKWEEMLQQIYIKECHSFYVEELYAYVSRYATIDHLTCDVSDRQLSSIAIVPCPAVCARIMLCSRSEHLKISPHLIEAQKGH